MTFARGYTDKIRCEVGSCRETYWAGSVWHAERGSTTLAQAAERGWSVEGRHLCPKHAYLAVPIFAALPGTDKENN